MSDGRSWATESVDDEFAHQQLGIWGETLTIHVLMDCDYCTSEGCVRCKGGCARCIEEPQDGEVP